MRWHRGTVTAAALLIIGGCANPQTGTPVAKVMPTSSTAASDRSPASPPSSIGQRPVSRPRSLDLHGVEPCSLLRAAQPARFGVALTGNGLAGHSEVFPGSRDCHYSDIRANLTVGLTTVMNEGFESYVDTVDATVVAKEATGYRFAIVRPDRAGSCFAVVDVSEGQMLYLSLVSGFGEPTTSPETVCQTVSRITEAVVQVMVG